MGGTKMKRKLLSALLCVSMVATMVAGCGNNTTGNKNSESEKQSEKASEKASESETAAGEDDPIAALIAGTDGPVDLTVWAAEEDQQMIKDMCEAFAAQYPEITYNFSVGVESESTAKDTVLTDPVAAADIFSFAGDQIGELLNASALQEVILNKDKVVEALGGEDTGAVVAAMSNGKLYAYPATADNGYFMFYNKSYFTEDDVKSLDAMLAVAETAGKKKLQWKLPADGIYYLSSLVQDLT